MSEGDRHIRVSRELFYPGGGQTVPAQPDAAGTLAFLIRFSGERNDGSGISFFGSCLTCTACEARFTFSYFAPGLCISFDCCANMARVPGIGGSLIGKLTAVWDRSDSIFFEMGACNPLYTGNPCPTCVIASATYAEEWVLVCADC